MNVTNFRMITPLKILIFRPTATAEHRNCSDGKLA